MLNVAILLDLVVVIDRYLYEFAPEEKMKEKKKQLNDVCAEKMENKNSTQNGAELKSCTRQYLYISE